MSTLVILGLILIVSIIVIVRHKSKESPYDPDDLQKIGSLRTDLKDLQDDVNKLRDEIDKKK